MKTSHSVISAWSKGGQALVASLLPNLPPSSYLTPSTLANVAPWTGFRYATGAPVHAKLEMRQNDRSRQGTGLLPGSPPLALSSRLPPSSRPVADSGLGAAISRRAEPRSNTVTLRVLALVEMTSPSSAKTMRDLCKHHANRS